MSQVTLAHQDQLVSLAEMEMPDHQDRKEALVSEARLAHEEKRVTLDLLDHLEALAYLD